MKHAIMVIGYGNEAPILTQCIKILGDKDIDFFIHWDKRYKLPNLKVNRKNIGKINFIQNRVAVKWGSYSQIEAELILFEAVKKRNNYDYVHLISANDLPLMTVDYFKSYFSNKDYVGFSSELTQDDINRIAYYYPNNMDFRKFKYIKRVWDIGNKLLNINRVSKYPHLHLRKGTNWFSMREKRLEEILSFENLSLFRNSFCADELLVQTILSDLGKINTISDDNEQASRYIDWNRGTPYTFNVNDINELKEVVNTKYAFVRKIVDPKIGKEIFKEILK